MSKNPKKISRLSLLLLLITALFLGSSCGAPQNVWSVKMESIYSKEILELKLRAQVYGAPDDGFFMFKPMVATTLEDLKIIAEDEKRVKAEIIRDGLLITKENTPTEYTGVAEPRFRRVVSHPPGKSEPVLWNGRSNWMRSL